MFIANERRTHPGHVTAASWRPRRLKATLTTVAGAVLLTVGAALIFVPAGLIVAGGFCLAAGLLFDFGS